MTIRLDPALPSSAEKSLLEAGGYCHREVRWPDPASGDSTSLTVIWFIPFQENLDEPRAVVPLPFSHYDISAREMILVDNHKAKQTDGYWEFYETLLPPRGWKWSIMSDILLSYRSFPPDPPPNR